MIVRELISRLGFAVDQQSVAKVDGTIRRVDDRARNLAASIRGMFAGIVGLHTIKSVFAIGDAMQSLEARIKLLPQTVGSAAASFDVVAKRASAARTSIDAYGNLYVRLAQSLRQYGFVQDDVLEVTDAISQALVVSGAQASEAASVTLQLSQAFNKGKLDGDEFRAFMEGLSADFKDKLSAEIGTTSDKLFELSRSGELTAKKLAEAFRNMAPEIRKQMLEMPMTVGQAVQIAGNRVSEFVVRLNRESSFITKIAKFVVGAVDTLSAGLDALGKRFNGLGNVIRYVGEIFALYFGAKFLAMISSIGIRSALAFGGMWLAIAAGVAVLDDIITWFRGGDSVIGDILGTSDEAKNSFVGFFAVLATGAGVFYGIKAAIVTARAAMIAWQGLVTLVTALQWVWNFAMSANPIGLLVIAIGALIGAGALLVANWTAVKDFFAGFLGGIGQKVVDWVKSIGSFFGGGSMDANLNQTVTPGQVAASAAGGKSGGNTMNKNTNVSVTVPPGTTAEQAAYLNNAARAAFSADGGVSTAEMGMFAP